MDRNLIKYLNTKKNNGMKLSVSLSIILCLVSLLLIIISDVYMYQYFLTTQQENTLAIYYTVLIVMMFITSVISFCHNKMLIYILIIYVIVFIIINALFGTVYRKNEDHIDYIYILGTIGIIIYLLSCSINIFLMSSIKSTNITPFRS